MRKQYVEIKQVCPNIVKKIPLRPISEVNPKILKEAKLKPIKYDPLSPIKILAGNVFHIDYIPEDYRKYCVFQAMSIDHSVGASAWDITITGQLRIASNKITKEIVSEAYSNIIWGDQ